MKTAHFNTARGQVVAELYEDIVVSDSPPQPVVEDITRVVRAEHPHLVEASYDRKGFTSTHSRSRR